MASLRLRLALIALLALASACASAEDRLAEGRVLQTQGRYFDAAYRYIAALEKDETLTEARADLLTAGDSAVTQARNDADALKGRGDPVAAADMYRQIDRLLAAARQVGVRIPTSSDYSASRRSIFDAAINWQMARGDEAAEAGRWSQARQHYIGARGDYLPTRDQVEESYDAEQRVLLTWAEVELADQCPRSAYSLAQQALELRASPSRRTVLAVRDLQHRALEKGTLVIAVPPVMAEDGVRAYLGPEFEMELDETLVLDYWTKPPLFVEVADPALLRRELRSLLRGRLVRSPAVVGRSLELIGADLGILVTLSRIEVTENDVHRDRHVAVIPHMTNPRLDLRRGQEAMAMDTVNYFTVEGELAYDVVADIVLVDATGRETQHFEVTARQRGPFQRGEFEGDPARLTLSDRQARFFDPVHQAAQVGAIETALMEGLATTVAAGTYEQVLRGIR